MRWAAKPDDTWRRGFASLPREIDGVVVWLEPVEWRWRHGTFTIVREFRLPQSQ